MRRGGRGKSFCSAKATLEKDLTCRADHADVTGKSVSGGGNSKCRGPEAGDVPGRAGRPAKLGYSERTEGGRDGGSSEGPVPAGSWAADGVTDFILQCDETYIVKKKKKNHADRF